MAYISSPSRNSKWWHSCGVFFLFCHLPLLRLKKTNSLLRSFANLTTISLSVSMHHRLQMPDGKYMQILTDWKAMTELGFLTFLHFEVYSLGHLSHNLTVIGGLTRLTIGNSLNLWNQKKRTNTKGRSITWRKTAMDNHKWDENLLCCLPIGISACYGMTCSTNLINHL